MANQQDITIIIPVYNRAGLVTRALDSVVEQTCPPKRVIVVDNNSSDNTFEVLCEYQKRTLPFELLVLQEMKPGAAAARNRGIVEIETSYAMFFDSDDTIPRDHVERTMKQFALPSKPDLVSWRGRYIAKNGNAITTLLPHGGDTMTSHLVHTCFSTSLMAMKTDLIRRAGGWDETLPVWDDYEWSTRLLLAAPVIESEDRIGGDFYMQEESLTGTDFSSKAGKWELAIDAIERNISASSSPEKAKWMRWMIYRRVILCALYARESGPALPSSRFPADRVRLLPPTHRAMLRFIYEYTRRGGRGAYHFYRLVNGW